MIKPTSSDVTVTTVWPYDEAIDQDAMVVVSDLPDPEAFIDRQGSIVASARQLAEARGDPPPDIPVATVETELPRVAVYLMMRNHDPSCWRDILKMHDGQRPTVFTLGVIGPTELTGMENEYSGKVLYLECFKAAVRDIQDGPTVRRKNGSGKWVEEVPKKTRNGTERVDPSFIEDMFGKDLRRCATDIGQIAWLWNQLGDEDAKNS